MVYWTEIKKAQAHLPKKFKKGCNFDKLKHNNFKHTSHIKKFNNHVQQIQRKLQQKTGNKSHE